MLRSTIFQIRQRNVIDSNAQFIVDENARFGRFDDRITRDAAGNLTSVGANLLNLGEREVQGIDLTVNYTHRADHLGRLDVSLNATHLDRYREKFTPGEPFREHVGTFSDEASEGNGALPDWKASLGISWQRAYWQASYDFYYLSAIREQVPGQNRRRTMGAWFVQNAQARYTGPATRWVDVTVGVNNLMDRAPPFSAAAFNDSYDSRTYDAAGRFWYLRLETSVWD